MQCRQPDYLKEREKEMLIVNFMQSRSHSSAIGVILERAPRTEQAYEAVRRRRPAVAIALQSPSSAKCIVYLVVVTFPQD